MICRLSRLAENRIQPRPAKAFDELEDLGACRITTIAASLGFGDGNREKWKKLPISSLTSIEKNGIVILCIFMDIFTTIGYTRLHGFVPCNPDFRKDFGSAAFPLDGVSSRLRVSRIR
jgi:hypothetical protein